jgi:hypothetical protein
LQAGLRQQLHQAAADLVAANPPASTESSSPEAYARGVADFRAQKAWFEGQTGDRGAGAQYWAGNRNVAGHALVPIRPRIIAVIQKSSSPAARRPNAN